jgi:hypothetical protein
MYSKKPIATNLAELPEEYEAAVIKLEGHIIYFVSPLKLAQLHVLSIREAGQFRQPIDEATSRCPWQI